MSEQRANLLRAVRLLRRLDAIPGAVDEFEGVSLSTICADLLMTANELATQEVFDKAFRCDIDESAGMEEFSKRVGSNVVEMSDYWGVSGRSA